MEIKSDNTKTVPEPFSDQTQDIIKGLFKRGFSENKSEEPAVVPTKELIDNQAAVNRLNEIVYVPKTTNNSDSRNISWAKDEYCEHQEQLGIGKAFNVLKDHAAFRDLPPSLRKQQKNTNIVNVYADNLDKEMAKIRRIVKKYNYVAMDTEFPGIVAIPNQKTQYQAIKVNVDLLKIIQVGLCFLDSDGNLAPGTSCWQFNFRYSLGTDMHAQDSIELLRQAGIPFDTLELKGIDRQVFAEMFINSGLCLSKKVNWVTFHAGYDFAYLIRLLRNDAFLPDSEEKFFELLSLYFPSVYDIKYMLKSCKNLEGGLANIAEALSIKRIGISHQAGSDAILTGQTFFRMREAFFEQGKDSSQSQKVGETSEKKYKGIIYGIGSGSLPLPAVYNKNLHIKPVIRSTNSPSSYVPTPLFQLNRPGTPSEKVSQAIKVVNPNDKKEVEVV